LRCSQDDLIDCKDLEGKSLSWLLDWKWLKTLSAVLLGGSAILNIWFAFGLLYPCYLKPFNHWYIWVLRFLHASGFFGVAIIGVFDVNEHHDWHMRFAFWLFIALSLECIVLLFIPENMCNVQKLFFPEKYLKENQKIIWEKNNYRIVFPLQILHAVMIPTFALVFFFSNNGLFEWIAIWMILFYYTWYSRDHYQDEVHTDLVNHPNCPEKMYGEFRPMLSLQRIVRE